MANYIYSPTNTEIFNEDFVLRVALENYHFCEGIINPELYLLRKLKNGDEGSISVVVEKLLDNPNNPIQETLELVPCPPSNPERKVFRINTGAVRNCLVGVTHTPSKNNNKHGSLHGHFTMQKASQLVELSEEVLESVTVSK